MSITLAILVSTLNDANNIPTLIVQKRNIVIDEMRSKIEEIKPLYLEEQVKELEDITSLYIEKINNSFSIDEIDSLKSNFLVVIDKVYTEIEMLEIQLLAKKEDAISKIRDLYSRCNIDSLNKSDADSINQKVIKCIDDIKNAENVETVEQLKDSIINELTSKFNLNSNN